MPYVKRKKYSNRYRRRRKKSYRRYKKVFSGTKNRPFGNKVKFVTRYFDRDILLNPGLAGTASTHIFSANGLYDPNISGTGHQPIGFDQLIGVMYDHYTVIKAKITVDYFNEDDTNPLIIGVYAKDNNVSIANPLEVIENGHVKYTMLQTANDGSKQLKRVVYNLNPNKFLGRSKPLSDPDLKGSVSSNPTEQCYFHVFAAPMNSSVDAGNVLCNVRLDYVAILTEPVKLNLS